MLHDEIIKKFEEERWLLLDGSISGERRKYWNEKIQEFSELKEMLNEAKDFSGNIDSAGLKLDDGEVDRLVEEAYKKMTSQLYYRKNRFNSFTMVTFAGAVSALIIIISLLFALKVDPAKDIYAWEDTNISHEINSIESVIKILNDDQYKKEIYNKLVNDSWTRALNVIKDQINSLENDIENNKL